MASPNFGDAINSLLDGIRQHIMELHARLDGRKLKLSEQPLVSAIRFGLPRSKLLSLAIDYMVTWNSILTKYEEKFDSSTAREDDALFQTADRLRAEIVASIGKEDDKDNRALLINCVKDFGDVCEVALKRIIVADDGPS